MVDIWLYQLYMVTLQKQKSSWLFDCLTKNLDWKFDD